MSQRNNQNSKGGTTLAVLAAAGIGAFIGYLGHSLFSEENSNAHQAHHHHSSDRNSVPIQPSKKCVICQDELKAPLEQLPCAHIFHRDCLLLWLDKSASCPTCRTELTGRQMDAYARRNTA